MSRRRMPAAERRTPKLLTMPGDAWAALDAICAERGCSRGEIVESLIHEETQRESAKGERA